MARLALLGVCAIACLAAPPGGVQERNELVSFTPR